MDQATMDLSEREAGSLDSWEWGKRVLTAASLADSLAGVRAGKATSQAATAFQGEGVSRGSAQDRERSASLALSSAAWMVLAGSGFLETVPASPARRRGAKSRAVVARKARESRRAKATAQNPAQGSSAGMENRTAPGATDTGRSDQVPFPAFAEWARRVQAGNQVRFLRATELQAKAEHGLLWRLHFRLRRWLPGGR